MAKRKNNRENFYKLRQDILPQMKLEMLNNNELIIDGTKGVLEYEENLIKLNTGNLIVSILGDSLIIKTFDNELAIIDGTITEISFA